MYDSIDFEVLPQELVDYLHYISAIKNKSSKTVYEYSLNLKLFLKYILFIKSHNSDNFADNIDDVIIKYIDKDFYNSITLNDAYSFLSYCKDVRHNSAETRARKVAAIRSFFSYLEKQNVVSSNPLANLDTPKKKKSLPKNLTFDQSVNLLTNISGKNKERDYAIIVLFLNCGLRLSELCALNLNDIKPDNSIVVTGKGNKQRVLTLNDACISAIEAYMKVRPNINGIDKDALFLSSRNKRISPKTVEVMVKNNLQKIGLGDYSVHKLRHTAATLMYQYGGTDVLVLKEILGHESVGTTQIYTHLVDGQIKEAINSNPLANIQNNETHEE